MAYHLHTTDIDKARAVGERALKTISFRSVNFKPVCFWVSGIFKRPKVSFRPETTKRLQNFPPTSELLKEESQLHCEGLLSPKEYLEALNDMSRGKSPGTDGLPCEFYKIFCADIVETLTTPLNFSYNTGKLAISQGRGIIKLIPKKEADLNLINHSLSH